MVKLLTSGQKKQSDAQARGRAPSILDHRPKGAWPANLTNLDQ